MLLRILALAWNDAEWKREKEVMREQQNREREGERDRVTWGSRWLPWHFLQGWGIRQSNAVLQQSDGTQPFPVLIPSISTPFPTAADRERLDVASRCQTRSVCPAQGQRVKTCNTPIQRQKAQQRLEQNRWSCAVMAAVTLLCHYYYNLAHLRKDSK